MNNKSIILRIFMLCMLLVFSTFEMWAGDNYTTYALNVRCQPTGAATVYAKNSSGNYSEGGAGTGPLLDSSHDFYRKYDNLKEGYTFLGWSEGAAATSASDITSTANEERVTLQRSAPQTTHYANFTCVQAVSANTIQGSVSCPYTVALNAEVTLTATAEDGYAFVGWKHGTDADFCSTEASYTFTTNSNNAGTYTAYFEEATDIVVTANPAGDAYWATFYAENGNYQAPEETEVYTVTLSGTTLTTNKIADGIVKSGQGVVLKATKGNLTMTKTETKPAGDFEGNSLKGTLTQINGNGSIYVLNTGSKGTGFYKLDENGRLAKNKAYLEYSGADAREFFLFDEATAISAPLVNSEEVNSEVYDLQGRRVKNAAKGVYIVNGRKVVIK